MLKNLHKLGLLDEYYDAHGFGTMQSTLWLGSVVKQITDRHLQLKILGIGTSLQSRPR